MEKYISIFVTVVVIAAVGYAALGIAQTASVPATQRGQTAPVSDIPHSTDPSQANIKMLVATSSYLFTVPAGSTVYEAFKILVGFGDVKYKSHETGKNDVVIDAIAGIPNAGGSTWEFYINGEKPADNMMKAKVKDQDIVEWRFEKHI